jgi:serine-type anaerobic sulfatase-maturating enzyme
MGRFLSDLYDRWLEHGDPEIRIREFDEIEHALGHGERGGGCKTAGECMKHYYIVEPNGDVGHCDLFRGDDSYYFGNLTVDDFATIRASEKAQQLVRERRADVAKMTSCPDFGVCQGWCPHESYLSRRHNPDHTDSCCGLRTFIDHVRNRHAGAPTEPREARQSRCTPEAVPLVRLPMPRRVVTLTR